jgi:exopolysaccharide production protein ExoQ
MPKSIDRTARDLPAMGSFGAKVLPIMPVFGIYYVLLILPFIPRDASAERIENILFWPLAAMLTLALIVYNRERIDYRFFRSVPVASLIAYLAFAAASVTWAFNLELAFSRLVVEMLAIIVVFVPFALPIRTKNAIHAVYLCYAAALVVSAGFVLTTPPSPIGHAGYLGHKQELGLLAAVGIILSGYELLHRGLWRISAVLTAALAFWLVLESQSKSALALAFVAIVASGLILLLCKKTRLTPAYVVAGVVVASMFVTNPIERVGYRLYGDATLTGRTGIWGFIEYQIAQKPWLGWGFHSYYFVPNSPHNAAPGYIKDMPSSHDGYMDVRLETGRVGYWIFLIFVYSSLHLIEHVRRKDPVRAWCYLSIALFAALINLLDTHWLTLTHFWLLYLVIVAESVRFSLPATASAVAAESVQAGGARSTSLRTRIAARARSSVG